MFAPQLKKNTTMGRGDIKTKRGKISNGSYGVRRKRKASKGFAAPAKKVKPKADAAEVEEVKVAAKKTTAKKAAPKKPKAEKAETKEKAVPKDGLMSNRKVKFGL